ncbi:flagellar biosynthesis protein FliR [Paenibacillus darwinianus]|uniref:Flagellar biosynthetic protein FliR n=1 Tax=Paenibacillus darwinianus TaxID=1380763 RepID=A0A9W5W802_9BACL|nr:flagellar biosynthetic protein FliR [Paenibacillus darwinianus]EXX91342.1 flagellar biosynthesis protein FliR [Paenibacillus darwinianus]EXX92305.1 flagellar biosynthesis protein FliR [Paenibacillus darwinianus]EXX92842.1 flagellar biosynthesis protein FliR [Paenibacillus darwinianus]
MNTFLQVLPVFLLIFCRITAFFVVAPLFSTRGVPNTFKVGLGFFISVIVFLSYGVGEAASFDMAYPLLVIREILTGVLLGFIVYLFFTVVQTAGAFIDLQMGLAMANIIDPLTGASAPMTGNFKYYLMLMLFLSMNGHHYMLLALMQSYDWIPLSNELFSRIQEGGVTEFLTRTLATTFSLALQLSAPLVVSMFLTDVGLGFLAKTAPQFNVFVIGVPIKLLVGFMILALTLPSLTLLFGNLFADMFESVNRLLAIVNAGPG